MHRTAHERVSIVDSVTVSVNTLSTGGAVTPTPTMAPGEGLPASGTIDAAVVRAPEPVATVPAPVMRTTVPDSGWMLVAHERLAERVRELSERVDALQSNRPTRTLRSTLQDAAAVATVVGGIWLVAAWIAPVARHLPPVLRSLLPL